MKKLFRLSRRMIFVTSLALGLMSCGGGSSGPQLNLLAGDLGGRGNWDGAAKDARFNLPTGVAVDSAGNLYVADLYNSIIRKISSNGIVSTLAGSAGLLGDVDGTGSAARFYGPSSVAVDRSGNVYVADAWNSTIRKISPGGVVSTLAGQAGRPGSVDGIGNEAKFSLPSGVAVDENGVVIVADAGNHTIRKITPGGIVSTLAGISGTSGSADGSLGFATFYEPRGVAVDASGNVYVADTNNSTIRKIGTSGIVTTLAGVPGGFGGTDGAGTDARFFSPNSLSIDNGGNIYVADAGNNTVRKITPSGIVSTAAGSPGVYGSSDGVNATARFAFPYGVAADANGNVFIADAFNATIRKLSSAGVVSTVAGMAANYGYADGNGAAAKFDYIGTVAADSSSIYVGDNNGTIRKISYEGAVTTVAGTAYKTGSEDGIGGAARFGDGNGNIFLGVAVDAGGYIYVADSYNSTIRKISPTGIVSTFAGTAGRAGTKDGVGGNAEFFNPVAVATDAGGNVYVADGSLFNGSGTLRKISPDGMVRTMARDINFRQVTVDASGNIYGTANCSIFKVTSGGIFTKFAGADACGSTDGTGMAAQFNNPQGITVDSGGNLYVADTFNNAIRKITPTGVVSTYAGSGAATIQISKSALSFPIGVVLTARGLVITTQNGVLVLKP